MPPLKLNADTVQEALDRADARHWTRNPPRSPQARLNYLLCHHGHDLAVLAAHLDTTPHALNALQEPQASADQDSLLRAVEREVIRLWQPRIRRRAHRAILHNNGQMMVSFRAWLGFTAAAGSSDDPRLRTLTLSLDAPHPERLLTAHHRSAPERELLEILSDAVGACYFHRNRPHVTGESVRIERVDYLEFYY
ncbi:telomere-protecting terminal protein Tpg [Streptomyces bacillaris]|uniref:telomere-protecting terminal protein Tpg n=1 Tax=Streptomyces bacillaris TaxID=68179 RepID=UPI0036FDF56A